MQKIGKYEIASVLGKGGMGVVYKAYDPVIEREVAIKLILDPGLDYPEIKERFYREAKSLGKLSHENITTLYDVGESDGKPFIVMEFLHGTDLRAFIESREPVSLLQKLDYAIQIARGLKVAHDQHIIHRDIKPENVKILENGRVKIMDFGIARIETRTVTQTGMMLGTPFYMSPEQGRGKKIDKRSDIFSFGVLLQELLTYEKPFEGESLEAVLYNIVHEPPKALTLADSNAAADLQDIISKCLEKNPEQRYSDFAEIIHDLTETLEKEKRPEIKPANKKPLKTVTFGKQSDAGPKRLRSRFSSKSIWVTMLIASALAGVSGWYLIKNFKEERVAMRATSPSALQQKDSLKTEAVEVAGKIENSTPPKTEKTDLQRQADSEKKLPSVLEGKQTAADATVAQQKSGAERARQNMDAAKMQVSGRAEDKAAEPLYQQALDLENAGDQAFAENKWLLAMASYNEAADRYSKARDTISEVVKNQKSQAEESKKIMLAEKEKVPTANQRDKRYSEAVLFEEKSDQAYEDGNFPRALSGYEAAAKLFSALANAANNRDEDIGAIVEELTAKFKTSVEQGDLNSLRSLYGSFLPTQEKKWATLFQYSKNRRAKVAIGNKDLNGANPSVELSFRLQYTDNKNREQELTQWYNWTLEQVNSEWKIASVVER